MFLYRLFFGFFIFFSFHSVSQNVERMEVEIITDEINRRLITEKALEDVSRNFVKNFLGEDKFNNEKYKIEKNIIKNNDRYILFTKIGKSIEQKDGTYLTKVSLGLSRDNLQSLLVEHNLFYASQGASCVLPIVMFKTNIKKKEDKYKWWKQPFRKKENLTQRLAKVFYSSLNQELIKNGFYSIDPIFSRTYESTPKVFLPNGNRTKHFMNLSKFLTCDIILSGTVQVLKNQKDTSYLTGLSFTVFNIKTKQKLFQFDKNIKFTGSSDMVVLEQRFESKLLDVFNSITFQLSFYKDRGSLDLNRVIVSVQGPLNLYQKEKLKEYLLQNISSIKGLQERLLASNQITYEAEISNGVSNLVTDIKKKSKNKFFNIQINGYNKQRLNIYAKEK